MFDPSLAERHNRRWMIGSLNFKNNRRGLSGKEDARTKWFTDINGLNWDAPYFRHVDGRDHTHFYLDIDIDVNPATKKKYSKHPDRLRSLKIKAGVEYFRGWVAEHSHHPFFWKISGTGLHAIQRIDRQIDRKRLVPLVLMLFPPTSKIEVEISPPKNHIHVKPPSRGRPHVPSPKDNGWCLAWEVDSKTGKEKYNKERWVRMWAKDGIVYTFTIDMHFFYDNTRIVRWTYSPYWNVPGRIYYSVPINEWDADIILKSSVIEGVEIKEYEIPQFSFRNLVAWDDTVTDELWIERSAKRSNYGRPEVEPYLNLNLYDVDDKLPRSLVWDMDRMTEMFLGNINQVSPCMAKHYSNKETHWSRFQLGRYLRAFDFSISQIANWFRFRINDDEDNSPDNRHRLRQNLAAVLGGEADPHRVASCAVMQDASSVFYCCDETMQGECRRHHPLGRRDAPIHTVDSTHVGAVLRDRAWRGKHEKVTYWAAIKNLIREAFDKDQNLVIWKATRAGVTTSMIRIAVERGKKLLVVVPTNRIGEVTFPEAMKIVQDDMDRTVNGAILASNRKGCLLLNFVEQELREMKLQSPEWGDAGIAWTHLRYHSKGDCSRCMYNDAIIETPIFDVERYPLPLYNSNILNAERKTGYCAYTTFKNQLNRFDVVFVTYSKLYSLMMHTNDDNEELKEDIYNSFDMVLLDEVATFANRSPLDVSVMRNSVPARFVTDRLETDVFADLEQEINLLSDFSTTKIAHVIIEFITKFIASFNVLKLKDWNPEKPQIELVQDGEDDVHQFMPHPLSFFEREELRAEFNKIHALLENYTKIENRILRNIEDVLSLMCEDGWVIVNTPTPKRLLDTRFVSAPKTAEVKAFIRRFGAPGNNKLVFTTDACMPEVNMSEFFEIGFEDFVVGDPRKTNENQLIIADTRNVGVIRFMYGSVCTEDRCKHWDGNTCNNTFVYTGKDPNNEWAVVQRTINARSDGGRCYQFQIDFMREINGLIDMYGHDNVIIVFPNKDIYKWYLKRIRWGVFPNDVEITYYRSDKTLGVPCTKRIMVCMGMPHTPVGSHLWLAHYYHQDGLFKEKTLLELEAKLRINGCRQAFWQTIGRAKAPAGDERSVVVAWGINKVGIGILFDFDNNNMKDTLPHIFLPNQRGHDDGTIYLVGRLWRTTGVVLNSALLRISRIAYEMKWTGKWIPAGDVRKYAGLTLEDTEYIGNNYTEDTFTRLGIEVKVGTWGANTTLTVRALSPPTES